MPANFQVPFLAVLLSPMPKVQKMQENFVRKLSDGMRAEVASLSGEWELDRAASEAGALREFLLACGAPRIFAGPLARKFDSDRLVITISDSSVTLATPRNGWSLPIKLQTDATYTRGSETILSTPRGNQRASLIQSKDGFIEIVKDGPAVGERVTERYTAVGGRLEQELHHLSPDGKKEVVVRRTFKRV